MEGEEGELPSLSPMYVGGMSPMYVGRGATLLLDPGFLVGLLFHPMSRLLPFEVFLMFVFSFKPRFPFCFHFFSFLKMLAALSVSAPQGKGCLPPLCYALSGSQREAGSPSAGSLSPQVSVASALDVDNLPRSHPPKLPR